MQVDGGMRDSGRVLDQADSFQRPVLEGGGYGRTSGGMEERPVR
jgi:hypothetical protein